MKIFWPTFWATLAAILVAAALIGFFIEIKSHFDALAEAEAETAALKAETARVEEDKKDRAATDAANEADYKKAEKDRAATEAVREADRKKAEKDRAATDAANEADRKKAEKEHADFLKAHGLPEPIYPTLDEAFGSPTPQPSTPEP